MDDQEEEDRHACLVGLVAFVAAHPDVLSVQMRARYGTAKEVASWIIQVRVCLFTFHFCANAKRTNGRHALTQYPPKRLNVPQSGGDPAHAQPLWDLGLTGRGELIGVSDTGLDDEHCYFHDAAKGRVQRSAWDAPVTDMGQRKVVQYVSFVDGGDFVEGHGTHVCGSIAGVVAEGWELHGCPDGETLACTGACLAQVW